MKKATEQDIQFYKMVYDRECILSEKKSEFSFIIPVNEVKYEIDNEFELDICNQNIDIDNLEMHYNFLGIGSFNQDNGSNLPYAA